MSSLYRIDFRLDPHSAADGPEQEGSPWLRVYTDDRLLGILFRTGSVIPPRDGRPQQFLVENSQVETGAPARLWAEDVGRWRVSRGQTEVEDLRAAHNELTEDPAFRFLLLVGETTNYSVGKITERLEAARYLERGSSAFQS